MDLNYAEQINHEFANSFQLLHNGKWGQQIEIAPGFSFQKINGDLIRESIDQLPAFDLIYFDAFAPNKQPDLWVEAIYQKLYNHSNPGAILVTYCAKGIVRRDLQQVGFNVERIQGPPGKKEMLRAIK